MTDKITADLMLAYHCTEVEASRLQRGYSAMHKAIRILGPLRCTHRIRWDWNAEMTIEGWLLDMRLASPAAFIDAAARQLKTMRRGRAG